MTKNILCVLLGLGLLSCSPESPKLMERVYTQKVSSAVDLDFNPKVDILFVVDDSGSMSSYQTNLSKNVEVLTKSIEKNRILNYHVGVITTSMEMGSSENWGGRLVSMPGRPKFIDRNTPNGLSLLKQYVQVGTNGSAVEKVFQPAESALSTMASNYNAGFLRSDAYLVFIFLTDAEDQSIKVSSIDYTAQDFYNFTVNLKGNDPKKVIPYGIIIPVNSSTNCTRDNGPPFKLEEYIKMLNGYVYDLCDPNYNSSLDFLGKDIVNRISKIMYLNRRPIVSTIKITYGGREIINDIEKGWSFDVAKNAIVFGDTLMESLSGTSDKLDISYTALPE